MRRAVIAFHRDGGDAQRALSAARAAHSALPDDADILLLLAEVQLAEGDVEQAIASLGRVAELRPGTAEPQVRLVEAFLAAKRPERAWAAAERALAMAPDWLPAARAVVGAAIATQRIPHARAVAQQWQQRQPRTPTGWLLEADIELSQARWDAGISALRKALEKGADAHAAWLLYRALNQSGRTAEARQHAEDWLRRHPRDTMFLNLLGDAALHRGDLAEAEARFAQALSIQPESPTLMNNLAFALVLQKKPEAKALALKAVQAAPYSAPVLDTLAHAFAAEGNAAKAVEIQTQVVELMPRATTYRVHLARFHLQAGDRKKAEEELDRLLAQLDGAPLPADVKALQQQLRG
jgi:Flp pilus assembly protein TadD